MKILLTNDDGVFAPGIKALAKELEKEHEVIVIAPEEEHSGQSHAITINRALIVKDVELEGIKSKVYSVSGTPADCVRVAMDKILEEKPDVIFSGCNLGYNAGMDILYSGTVSAAVEGNIFEIPSLAVSTKWVEASGRFDTAAKIAIEIFNMVKDDLLHPKTPTMVLNINVPYMDYEELKGIKVAEIGDATYDYYFEEEVDGNRSLVLKGRNTKDSLEGTDRAYLEEGFVTLTPLIYDFNNTKLSKKVAGWLK